MNPFGAQNKANARGYVRVSTSMQADDGQSIETQVKRIQAHCDYRGLNLVKIYQDAGISGKDTNRPALQEVMNDLNKGEYLIISDLSRLSRNTKDALNLLEAFKTKGIYFVCLSPEIQFDASPIGELMFTILMAVHKLERDNISKHVSVNMQRLSEEGKLRGKPPFGYKFVSKDQDFVEVPEQIRVRDKIVQFYQSGMKVTHIAQKLNSEKDNLVLSLNKNDTEKEYKFHPSTVKRILIDLGLVKGEGSYAERKPVEERIFSHHKSD